MGRGDRLDVELHEDESVVPEATTAAPRPHGGRHRGRWAVALVVVAALALTAAQVVSDVRERSVIASLAGVEGLLAPLDGPVQVRWERTDVGWPVAVPTPDGAALVSLRDDGAGGIALTGLDPATGETLWGRDLRRDVDERPPGVDPGTVRCATRVDASGLLTCLRPGRETAADGSTVQSSGAGGSWTVDARTGDLVGDVPLEVGDDVDPRSVAVLDDLVVLVSSDADVVHVRGVDLRSGAERWRRDLPPTPDDPRWPSTAGQASVEAVDATTVAVHDGRMLTLMSSDGVELRRFDTLADLAPSDSISRWTSVDRSRHAAVVVRNEGTSLVAVDGEVTVRGVAVGRGVDDGSVPDLLLTAGDTVRAWDAGTGEERWALADATSAGGTSASQALVLRGRVHLSTDRALVTLDGRTGEELWRSPTGLMPFPLLSDGRVVLLTDPPADGDDEGGELVALDVAGGRERWRVPLVANGWVFALAGRPVVVVDDPTGEGPGLLQMLG